MSDIDKKRKETGSKGESYACQYLVEHGYDIIERNWKLGKNEIDIIALGEDNMVFVEVKTRHDISHGTPEEAVDRKKQRIYVRLADAYMRQNNRPEEARFDIIAIVESNPPEITHIKNAFTIVDVNFS